MYDESKWNFNPDGRCGVLRENGYEAYIVAFSPLKENRVVGEPETEWFGSIFKGNDRIFYKRFSSKDESFAAIDYAINGKRDPNDLMDCVKHPASSRSCEHGTRGCIVVHTRNSEEKIKKRANPNDLLNEYVAAKKPPTYVYECSSCGKKHDAINNDIPSTMTTKQKSKQEWLFVCAPYCAKVEGANLPPLSSRALEATKAFTEGAKEATAKHLMAGTIVYNEGGYKLNLTGVPSIKDGELKLEPTISSSNGKVWRGVCIFCHAHDSRIVKDNLGCTYGMSHEFPTIEKEKQVAKKDNSLCKKCGMHPKNPKSNTADCAHEYIN